MFFWYLGHIALAILLTAGIVFAFGWSIKEL